MDDIRRLVYDLRPPALDELGLLGTVWQQAERLSTRGSGVDIRVDAPVMLATLGAQLRWARTGLQPRRLLMPSATAMLGTAPYGLRPTDSCESRSPTTATASPPEPLWVSG